MKARTHLSANLFLPVAIGAAVLMTLGAAAARADVKLPGIFSDHMVLQASAAVPVWGWAEPGENVAVSVAGQSLACQADKDGKWIVKLNQLKPTAEPQTLTVKGKNTVIVSDVLVGEVWLASGQSNMAFLVNRGLNAEEEKSAAHYPGLRMFTVTRSPQRTPQADCSGRWEVCGPETVGNFSAVAYFFGRDLHQRLGIPVGVINSSYGGTDIAAWTSQEAQSKSPELQGQIDKWLSSDAAYDPAQAKATYEKQLAAWKTKVRQAKAAGKPAPRKPRQQAQPARDPNFPTNLYNGMIAPLIPYSLRGAIWYQGEHNTSRLELAELYGQQLPLLVEDWRSRWGSDFPFAWVQLPNLDRKDFRPLVRDAMLQSLRVKNTGMAVTIDIGEPGDNHPKNKQEVGRRLALWALGTVYGQKVPATSGPLPAGHKTRGSEVVLSFTHTDGGLVAKGGELRGFQIAGADKVWKPAQAKIDGADVIVGNPDVKQPVAVRYAWAGNPDCNLYNGAGLPASPFRTDDWK
ncbi:MAG TPA: sialate O-acetylesterase [Pirellulales bacterium]